MKKLYNYKTYVRFEGEANWKETSMFRHIHFMEEEEAIQNSYESAKVISFDSAKQIVENNMIMNAEVTKTIFTRRTAIRISRVGYQGDPVMLTEKSFTPFEYKVEYKEEKNITIAELVKMLPADEFCEYLKDRGIEKFFEKRG